MLTRIYINNFRCLVAFEMRFDEAALLCGMNGSGKSAVFDAVKLVRDLAAGNCFLGYADDESKRTVSRLEFCKWLASDIQEFELEFEDDGSKYIYILHVQQVADYEQPRILKEVIRCDGEELLTRDLISIRFEKDKSFFFSWNQSALSVFQPSNSQKGINKKTEAIVHIYYMCLF